MGTTCFRVTAKDFYEKQPYYYESEIKSWWMWQKRKWNFSNDIDLFVEFDKQYAYETDKYSVKNTYMEAYVKIWQCKET